MQVISSSTGREHTVSSLRLRHTAPNDLLVLTDGKMVAIPEALVDGNVLTAEAEERLTELGLINTLFDDYKVADLYDDTTTLMECDLIEEMLDLCPHSVARMLDVGCGVGRLLVPLATRGHQIDGLDISPEAIDHLRARLETQEITSTLIVGDISRTAITPPYDFAFAAMNTIRYVGNRARFVSHLGNMRRSVTDNGAYAFNMSFSNYPARGRATWATGGIRYTWHSGHTDVINHQIDEVVTAHDSAGAELHREIQLQYAPPFDVVTELLSATGWRVHAVYSNVGTVLDDWSTHEFDYGSRWILCRKSD